MITKEELFDMLAQKIQEAIEKQSDRNWIEFSAKDFRGNRLEKLEKTDHELLAVELNDKLNEGKIDAVTFLETSVEWINLFLACSAIKKVRLCTIYIGRIKFCHPLEALLLDNIAANVIVQLDLASCKVLPLLSIDNFSDYAISMLNKKIIGMDIEELKIGTLSSLAVKGFNFKGTNIQSLDMSQLHPDIQNILDKKIRLPEINKLYLKIEEKQNREEKKITTQNLNFINSLQPQLKQSHKTYTEDNSTPPPQRFNKL